MTKAAAAAAAARPAIWCTGPKTACHETAATDVVARVHHAEVTAGKMC